MNEDTFNFYSYLIKDGCDTFKVIPEIISREKSKINTANIMKLALFAWDESKPTEFKIMKEYWDSLFEDTQQKVRARLKKEGITLNQSITQIEWVKQHEHTDSDWLADIYSILCTDCNFDQIQLCYQEQAKIVENLEIPNSYKYAKALTITNDYIKELEIAANFFLSWEQRLEYKDSERLAYLDQLIKKSESLREFENYLQANLPAKSEEGFKLGNFFCKFPAQSFKDGIIKECNTGLDIVKGMVSSKRCLQHVFKKSKETILCIQPFNNNIKPDRRNEFRLFVWNGKITAASQQVWHTVFNYTEDEIKELMNAIQILNDDPNSFIKSACTIDAYLHDGKLHIIEYNEPMVSASAAFDYTSDYELLYPIISKGIPIRLLKERIAPEEVKTDTFSLEPKPLRFFREQVNKFREEAKTLGSEKFAERLQTLGEEAWVVIPKKADEINKIVEATIEKFDKNNSLFSLNKFFSIINSCLGMNPSASPSVKKSLN